MLSTLLTAPTAQFKTVGLDFSRLRGIMWDNMG